ncbi:hypothetical protein BHM03_00011166 [Ensete ventricosum]|uniref:Kinesin motor domain-containing protein n=1 Tax=Ensete ventricosum TaxID=4639 RepID=A0A445MDD4_ENSVE|nr:hypothetical protein BHM03_00011166 [Ensete ventricosum]
MRHSHIPYRNNKLTQILSGSLGHNSKVLMIVHISLGDDDAAETVCPLSFAKRVREEVEGERARGGGTSPWRRGCDVRGRGDRDSRRRARQHLLQEEQKKRVEERGKVLQQGTTRAIAEDNDTARKMGYGSGGSCHCHIRRRNSIENRRTGAASNGHPLEISGGAEISSGEDGGGVAVQVLMLGDEATMDDGTTASEGADLRSRGTAPTLSPEKESTGISVRSQRTRRRMADGALARV